MREINPGIFIEFSSGMTLGAIYDDPALVLIDAPFSWENAKQWRSELKILTSEAPLMVIHLDAHLDRTIGARYFNCMIAGQSQLMDVFNNRPATFKAIPNNTGAAWEECNSMNSFRWVDPEITFSDSIDFRLPHLTLHMEHHIGPSPSSSWAIIPERDVIFIGDTVVRNQAPFLEDANIANWIASLELLKSSQYSQFTLISGRDGIVNKDDINRMEDFLWEVNKCAGLISGYETQDKILEIRNELLSGKTIHIDDHFSEISKKRLSYGLKQYYERIQHQTHLQIAEMPN